MGHSVRFSCPARHLMHFGWYISAFLSVWHGSTFRKSYLYLLLLNTRLPSKLSFARFELKPNLDTSLDQLSTANENQIKVSAEILQRNKLSTSFQLFFILVSALFYLIQALLNLPIILSGSQQDLSRISAEFQQNLSRNSAESQQNLSRISAES